MMPPPEARRATSENVSLLGSSLSSDAARKFLQICHEALENGIRDTPLEASQRFLTRFALRPALGTVQHLARGEEFVPHQAEGYGERPVHDRGAATTRRVRAASSPSPPSPGRRSRRRGQSRLSAWPRRLPASLLRRTCC